MAIIFSNVDCEIYNNSVNESFTREGGLSASVQLRCNWNDRIALVNDLIYNRRTWPYATAQNPPIVRSVSITQEKPCGSQDGQGYDYSVTDSKAICSVQYESISADGDAPSQDSPVDYDVLVENIETNVEFLTLAPKMFKWNTPVDGKDVAVAPELSPTKRIWGLNYTRQLIGVRGSIPDEVFTKVGHCNNSVFTSKYYGYDFAIETLLYNGAQIERTFTALGEVRRNLTLNFQWTEQTWNYFWNPTKQVAGVPNTRGDWDQIKEAKSGEVYKIVPVSDLSNLLF